MITSSKSLNRLSPMLTSAKSLSEVKNLLCGKQFLRMNGLVGNSAMIP
jgi:hypothetical protein